MINNSTDNSVYDTMIRMFILLLVVVWCLLIMYPFVNILLWGLILAVAFMPMQNWLSKVLGNKPKLSSFIIIIIALTVIVLPVYFFLDSLIESIKDIKASYAAGTLSIPTPTEKVKAWPIIGHKTYEIWLAASNDLKIFIAEYKEQLAPIGKKLISGILGTTSGTLQFIGAIIIAGILLVQSGTGESIRKFFRKVAGDKGDEFADIVKTVVGNVVKGVLGVALIQSTLIGLGFVLADIPLAGFWTLLVLIFAILQLPPTLIILPVVIYIFSEMNLTPAILWTIYLVLAGLSDNILKPLLLGQGAPVPMLIIFIGVVGGFMFSGFIGLFTGAIVFSIGYKLLTSWMSSDSELEKI